VHLQTRLEVKDLAQMTPPSPGLLTIGQVAERARLNTSHIPARAVKRWLEVAQHCDCASVDVCGLFVDPTLLPPAGDINLDVRSVRRA
jgi:hypothetical protein